MKLSIIVPVYNTAEYLPKCLDSVICPGVDGYEIIIVNDGSTDSSKAVAESYVNQYPELIRLINTENGGLGQARNVGIENARGEYLLFLDSDDSLARNAVPEIMEALRQDYDIFIYDFVFVNPDGAVLSTEPGCRRQGVADALVTGLLHRAAAIGLATVTLEVRQSNAPAIALYHKHGFVPVGRRKNYYTAPTEDAILMTAPVK